MESHHALDQVKVASSIELMPAVKFENHQSPKLFLKILYATQPITPTTSATRMTMGKLAALFAAGPKTTEPGPNDVEPKFAPRLASVAPLKLAAELALADRLAEMGGEPPTGSLLA